MFNKEFEQKIIEISKLQNIVAIILFGSYAKGTQKPNSDYDIAVIVKNNNKKTIAILESMKTNKFDIISFNKIPLYVKYEVFKFGKILFVNDNKQFEKETYTTMLEVQDNYHHYTTLVNYRDNYGLQS